MKTYSLLMLLSLTSVSMGATIWNINADGMTAGGAPTVSPVVSGLNTAFQAYTNGNAANKVEVVNNFTANGLTMSGHSLVFQKTTAGANQELTLIGAGVDWKAWENYELAFDLLVDSRTTGQPLNVRMANSNSLPDVAALTFGVDGSLLFSSQYSSGGVQTIAGAWDITVINSIVVQVDADAQSLSAFINGRLVSTIALDLANEETNGIGINRIRFRNNSNNQLYANGFAIDNIMTSTILRPIPEPSQAALLLLTGSAVGLGLRARRR